MVSDFVFEKDILKEDFEIFIKDELEDIKKLIKNI